jgi:hypothetical protein
MDINKITDLAKILAAETDTYILFYWDSWDMYKCWHVNNRWDS